MRVEYTNVHGEKLTLEIRNGDVMWNHSDIHTPMQFEYIVTVKDYILNDDEMIIIDAFKLAAHAYD